MTKSEYSTHISEYLTFGLGIHYLLKAIIIQFVALLLTYQFARPLSISVSKPNLFMVIYSAISLVFSAITLFLSRNMCKRVLNPEMHNKRSVIISTIFYHLVAAVVVVSGYTLLIIAVSGMSQINGLDLSLSLLFTTAFAAILTVGYHDEFDDHLPTVETLEQATNEWVDNTSWVDEKDNSQAQRDRLNAFEDSCDEIKMIFANANTQAGKQLTEDFEVWVSSFKDHKGQAKELVVQGQRDKERKNQELQTEHMEFERLKSRLEDLSS